MRNSSDVKSLHLYHFLKSGTQVKKFSNHSKNKQNNYKIYYNNIYLDWVNVMSDYDKLSFFLFNKFSNCVGTGTECIGALGWGLFFLGNFGFSFSLQPEFLLKGSLRSVLLKNLEKLGCWN